MAPLLEKLKSVLMFEETATAPTINSPSQITIDNSTINTIGSADLPATDAPSLMVLEALDGNVKGQMVLVRRYNTGTQVANTTPFFETPSSFTQARYWDIKLPKVVHASATTGTTTIIDDDRNEADDYWNDYKMLVMSGGGSGNDNQELVNISDFVSSTGTFTVGTMTNASANGDTYIPVQPLQPVDYEMALSGGAAIEREITTDTLAQEGILVGAMDDSTLSMGLEIRGLASAAGDGTAASPPGEAHAALKQIFTETLTTGDTANAGASTTSVGVADGTRFSQYALTLVNGEAAAITSISGNTLTLQANHLNNAPGTSDVLYGGATYKPIDTGHGTVGFINFHGDSEFSLLTGCMPSFGVSVEPNGIAKYQLDYKSIGGFWAPFAKGHEDIYDTTTPLLGKSNVNRVVLDGSELTADVLSLSAELLPEPSKKGASFGAFENNGGYFYTVRQPQVTMRIYFQDSDLLHKYRALKEMDLLVQMGSQAGGSWALWAPRVQLVENPQVGAEEDLMIYDLTFRCLRPTTASQPDFVIAHF